MMMKKPICLSILVFLGSLICRGGSGDYVISRIDDKSGLSHSAVLSICQDRDGLMWFGTYDGLDCYDGREMSVFRSGFDSSNTLSNNVIQSVQQADGNNLWVVTHMMLNRFSCESRCVTDVYDFKGNYSIESNSDGDTWLILRDSLFYYNTRHSRFIGLGEKIEPSLRGNKTIFVTNSGTLWNFLDDSGFLRVYTLNSFDSDSTMVNLSVTNQKFHSKSIEEAFCFDNTVCFIDDDMDLFVYDIEKKSKIYIRNVADLKQKYGEIHGIIPFYDDIFIGFFTNGLVRLLASDRYSEEEVDKNMRIFDMYKDDKQGILWVGTDGCGAASYTLKYNIAGSLMLNRLSDNLSRPVRSILTDEKGNLWFGTKGDGIIMVPDYLLVEKDRPLQGVEVFSPSRTPIDSYTRDKEEFQVYDLEGSLYRDGFWVGTGAGLYWFSYQDKTLRKVSRHSSDHPEVGEEIHSIIEAGEDCLFIATGGFGFSKLQIGGSLDRPEILSSKRYHFYDRGSDIDMFYQMIPVGDSLIWLGSRGSGLVRFDRRSEEYKVISLRRLVDRAVDDILSLCMASDSNLYIGTTSGIVRMRHADGHVEGEYIGRGNGLLNDMVHGILEDSSGFLWISSNKGLTKYNPITTEAYTYYRTGGVTVAEFSDDAFYRDYEGNLFFGGVDGLIWLTGGGESTSEESIQMVIRSMSVDRKEVNLSTYYRDNGEGKYILLKGNRVSFSLKFVIPDFINRDIEYSYTLAGFDEDWSEYSGGNEAFFYSVPPGKYVFKVRHRHDVYEQKSEFSIPIVVRRKIPLIGLLACILGVLLLLAVLFALLINGMPSFHRAAKSPVPPLSEGLSLDDRFAIIYHSCEKLQQENLSSGEKADILNIIKETVGGALPTMDIDIRAVLPSECVISTTTRIADISSEVLLILNSEGMDVSSLRVSISDGLVCPVYINVLRRVLYLCYGSLAEHGGDVSAGIRSGALIFSFSANQDAVNLLMDQLKSAFSGMFDRLKVALTQSSGLVTLTFAPVSHPVRNVSAKRKIVLLGASYDLAWLICDILSSDWNVVAARNFDEVLPDFEHGSIALLLVDMAGYNGRESDLEDMLYKHRPVLSGVSFVPMFTSTSSIEACKELVLVSDAYMMLPHDILLLKNVVHKAVYGKSKIGFIKAEELSVLGGHLVITNESDTDFVERVLSVIDSELDNEGLGTVLLGERLAMSESKIYRRFIKVFRMAPEVLIKNYRLEKAARLLKEGISISDVIADVGILSRSYFYKEFSARFGMSPKKYRDKFCSVRAPAD